MGWQIGWHGVAILYFCSIFVAKEKWPEILVEVNFGRCGMLESSSTFSLTKIIYVFYACALRLMFSKCEAHSHRHSSAHVNILNSIATSRHVNNNLREFTI